MLKLIWQMADPWQRYALVALALAYVALALAIASGVL
jgi:hypothetical protein